MWSQDWEPLSLVSLEADKNTNRIVICEALGRHLDITLKGTVTWIWIWLVTSATRAWVEMALQAGTLVSATSVVVCKKGQFFLITVFIIIILFSGLLRAEFWIGKWLRSQVCSLFSICTFRSICWPFLFSAQEGWPLYCITQVLLPFGSQYALANGQGETVGQEEWGVGHLFLFLISYWFCSICFSLLVAPCPQP